MSLIKCKMCGGDLIITPGITICECEYCGSKQTIPITDDEKRIKLYERANKLRFNCEFDKAAGVYESIVSEYQDEAEAYWGLVLCKYGIEYVDDPKTGKKIPTCHRSSFDCIFDDNNFEMVMENADVVARGVYREEAKQIEELRKGIIEVSSKEEPYDIFICYKETADDGQRTIDSVIAQDVYEALIEKDYRVFFSRITLEDKLGQEYEPYIFAALNSAKVMLAFGTCYDYYNAVWVKNEWSRFLQLMEFGQKKTLIPCYKNIDAYDMPKEFAKLQAQDMGKVGAIQDLLRGIDKIFGRDKKLSEAKKSSSNIVGDGNALVKRGYFALEDGEWEKALEYFDQALNQDAENAEIHLGIFLAKRHHQDINEYLENQIEKLNHVTKKELLACRPDDEKIEKIAKDNCVKGYLSKTDISQSFSYNFTYKSIVDALKNEKSIYEDRDWKKAERFAQGDLAFQIKSIKDKHISEIDSRIEAEQENDKASIDIITNNYRKFIEDTEKKIIDKRFQAESQRERDYISLCDEIEKAEKEEKLRNIITRFEQIKYYKESENKILECKNKIKLIKEKEEKENQEKKLIKQKKIKKLVIVAVSIVALIIAVIIAAKIYELKVIIPNNKYEEAISLMENQKYEEALAILSDISDYKDSQNKIEECNSEIKIIEEAKEKEKEATEREKNRIESEAKFEELSILIDRKQYKTVIEEIGEINDAEIKGQLIDLIIESFGEVFNTPENIHAQLQVSSYVIKLLEFVDNDDQKQKLAEVNDEGCISKALVYLSKKPEISKEFLNSIINRDNYASDISTIEDIITIYEKFIAAEDEINNINRKNDSSDYNWHEIRISYENSTHCFSVNYVLSNVHLEEGGLQKDSVEKIDGYIVSYDSDSISVGEANNVATKKINLDLSIDEINPPEKEDPLTTFIEQ